jgi:hypothetical protein
MVASMTNPSGKPLGSGMSRCMPGGNISAIPAMDFDPEVVSDYLINRSGKCYRIEILVKWLWM